MIGSILNQRYRLDSELGHGGMGIVYRGYDQLLERDIAVKVLNGSALSTIGRDRLLREARAVAHLSHPNIVRVYDAGECEGSYFIIMELVDGQTLDEQRSQPVDSILTIAKQICAALNHAHSNGIVHRDLKPENIKITPDGVVKLMDFGLARSLATRLTSEGTIVGTVFYLAPEQALGQEVDGRADLYALGVILYELTTGSLPFTGDDPLTVISQHLNTPLIPPRTHNPEIPPALDTLICRLMAKKPEDRAASAVEVGLALEELTLPTPAPKEISREEKIEGMTDRKPEVISTPISSEPVLILPTGTVTFLFTDIEGSTPLWERDAEAMQKAVSRHQTILHRASTQHGGHVFKIIGDEFQISFELPAQALQAALAAQRALRDEHWGSTGPLAVRMGLHTGPARLVDGVFNTTDYAVSHTLNRVARIRSAGHGGQILLSAATMELLRGQIPQDVGLKDMGEHHLKGMVQPEHIFQVIVADLKRDFPALKTLDSQPNNLPIQATPFIGRQAEVTAVCNQLLRPEVRLLTLTGPGGSGKTRLALQVAAEMLEEFPGGVYFVALASIGNPDLVIPAIAQALHVREQGNLSILNSLINYLGNQHILLLLDNIEQVAQSVGEVSNLLEVCPNLKILVTSRTVLHIYGEHDFAVPPLSLPDRKSFSSAEKISQYEAVQLFIERALAILPNFSVTNETAPAIAEICYRLDGLPLAIELAASRINLLSSQAILSRLEHRLPLLTEGSRNLPARQQTLRKTIDWSYELLDPAEQDMFTRISVFAGGFSLDAVEAVVGEVNLGNLSSLDCLSRLVDNSLLSRMDSRSVDNESRLAMLETLREYAQEKLTQNINTCQQVQESHASYFLRLAEDAAPNLQGSKQVYWFSKFELEYDNFRAALDWYHRGYKLDLMARLCISLTRYWYLHGYPSEGLKWVDQLLAQAENLSMEHHARLLNSAGVLACAQADNTYGEQCFEKSLILQRQIGNARGIADALNGLGSVVLNYGDYPRALNLYLESLQLHRQLGDTWGIARVLNNLGLTEFNQSNYDQAAIYLKESLELSRQIQDISVAAYALLNLGRIAIFKAQPVQSKEWLEQSLSLQEQLGNKRGMAIALVNLGQLAGEYGDPAQAIDLCRKSLAISLELGDKRGEGFALMTLGEAAFYLHEYTLSLDYSHQSIPLLIEAGDRWSQACCLNDFGRVKVELNELAQAVKYFQESLKIWREVDDPESNTANVIGLATVLIARGQNELAIRLISAVTHFRETKQFPFTPAFQKHLNSYLSIARGKLEESTFNLAWERGCQMSFEQALEESARIQVGE